MAEEANKESPISAEVPPKVNPLGAPVVEGVKTVKLNPVVRKPIAGATQTALKPGLKLPTQPALKPGLKLPTQTALKPGLKLPTKPGATVGAKPLPRPMIRKPGEGAPTASALPKPVSPVAPVAAAPVAPKPAEKPVAVDQQGVGKLPTVEMKPIPRTEPAPVVSENPNAMEALKTVTQKLKGVTQQIPQQAILRKTGIIADGVMSDAQKEAAKHKTARISLSDAMGVAPVKEENAPMKTIKIKRPAGLASASAPKPAAVAPAAAPAVAPAAAAPAEPVADAQKPALKLGTRPTGKFGLKRPNAPAAAPAAAGGEAPTQATVAEIADIPDMPLPMPSVTAPKGSSGSSTLDAVSAFFQLAACLAIGFLGWLLYQATQINLF